MTDKPQRHNPSPSQDAQPSSGGAPPEVLSGHCPTCGQKLKAPVGTVGRCQKCQSKLEFTHDGLRLLQGQAAGEPPVSPAEVTKPAEGIHGRCPSCTRDVKVLIGAPGPCPHCGARICYNGKEIVALRPTEVPSSPADPQGDFGIQVSDEGALPGRRGIPRAWLIGGTIVALMLLSALSIFFFGGPRQTPPAPDENVIVESDPGNEPSTAKRDPVEIPEISSGGVFTSPETVPQRTPDPTSSPVRPSRSSGSRGDWVLAVAAGQRVVVDGFELVPTGRFERDWTAVMPPGTHLVRLGDRAATKITVGKGFPEAYQLRRSEVISGGKYDFGRLVDRSLPTLGVATEPVLAHLWGNYYWQEQEYDAALRAWKEAIRLNPGFAPSHLNLAYALAERKDMSGAGRELEIAFHMNHHDAFGIAAHIEELAVRVPLSAQAGLIRFHAADFDELSAAADLSPEQLNVLRTLETVRSYVVDERQRIRVVNNMGAYLLHESQPAAAYEHFRRALREIVAAPDARSDQPLLRTVLENLGLAADRAKMAEAKFYLQLSKTIR